MSNILQDLIVELRAEAAFNRSFVDGSRDRPAAASPGYEARRTELAEQREAWADAVETLLAASPVEQPAAAPNEDHECVYENGDGICRECAELAKVGRTAPSPADERAAKRDAELDARLAEGDGIIEELVSVVRTAAQAPAQLARMKALRDAVEGECDGLAIDEKQATSILSWLDSKSPNGIVTAPAHAGIPADELAALFVALGHFKTSGSVKCAASIQSIIKRMSPSTGNTEGESA